LTQPILKNLQKPLTHRKIEQYPYVQNPWYAPFFYEDSRHAFYVIPGKRSTQISQWDWYGTLPELVPPRLAIPPLVFESEEVTPERCGPIFATPNVGVVDHGPIDRFVSEDAYINKAIGTTGTVRFGDKEIGPWGVVSNR
jgi:hypothetical protein